MIQPGLVNSYMLATLAIEMSSDGEGGIVDSLFTPLISLIHLAFSLIIQVGQPRDKRPRRYTVAGTHRLQDSR